jgi:PAS domain S-box-containing protein
LEKVFATSDKQSCEILMRVEERTLWLNIEANVGETPTDCLLAMTDITKRKQAEESLWVNEAQYRSIIQTAQDGIWRADKEGNLLEVNASYCRLSGYSEQELLTMRVADLENTGTLDETLTDTLKQDEADVTRFSVQHRRKDGSVFEVEISKQYRSEDGGQFVLFIQDITERKTLENQLRQSQKMESLVNLAGGIAHEFNNILAVILGHTDIATKKILADSPVKKHLQVIYKSIERASALASQILMFSRKSEVNYHNLNLSLLVRDALAIIRVSVPANIDIHNNLPAECPIIKADNTQIHQIILSLCSNAAHAMGQSNGTIEVTVQSWSHCPPHLGLGNCEYLELRVQDSGEGISETALEQIFDPFFTTKDVGKGTGLGLSVVHGIVEKHHGKIVAESEIGLGATFSIYLPVVDEVAPATQTRQATTEKGQGHIMIVDDQPELI